MMFNLDETITQGRDVVANSYVTYGPIADAHNTTDSSYMDHTWFVEVAFNLADDQTKHTWIAVLHVKSGGGSSHVVSCQLGGGQADAQKR
jgi:hypothetical protein